jgi:hypothetical protein
MRGGGRRARPRAAGCRAARGPPRDRPSPPDEQLGQRPVAVLRRSPRTRTRKCVARAGQGLRPVRLQRLVRFTANLGELRPHATALLPDCGWALGRLRREKPRVSNRGRLTGLNGHPLHPATGRQRPPRNQAAPVHSDAVQRDSYCRSGPAGGGSSCQLVPDPANERPTNDLDRLSAETANKALTRPDTMITAWS